MKHQNLAINAILVIFGLFVSLAMAIIYKLYQKNAPAEL
jgi:hypothetical protein